MRLKHGLFATAMSLMLGASALVSAPVSAESVDTWMTVATNHPAAGCVVDTSVEVQNSGAPVFGAEVTIILSDDATSAVIDTMSATTTETGYAWLSFDTTNASTAKTWLEVRVNGAYLGGRTIWIDGTQCAGAPSVLDLSGDVPSVSDTYVAAPAETVNSNSAVESTADGVFLSPVFYVQQRNLSCEYAAVQIATTMIGTPVSEYDVEAVTPLSSNPHWGYRGNINGWWGNTDDYGVYPEALEASLSQYGVASTTFYGGPSDLTGAIDNGTPVVVWMGMRGDYRHDEYAEDGTRYAVSTYMHVMVVYGYDESGVYLSDPANGSTRFYDWATFNWMWQVMDGMGLIVGN